MGRPLVLGELVDFITGRTIVDTEDERYRQKLARFLVEDRGYLKEDILVQQGLPLAFEGKTWVFKVDFAITLQDRVVMIVRFAPGAIVSRERPALAVARLLKPYVIPFAVVTNGRQAHLLDTWTAEVIAEGLEAIPTKAELSRKLPDLSFRPLPEKQLEKERRILCLFDAVAVSECERECTVECVE